MSAGSAASQCLLTATAGLRIVNSSLSPGYKAYYCMIAKHTLALTHKGEMLAVCGLRTLREPDSSVLFQGGPESTTNNNRVKPTPSASNPIRAICYSSEEV